VLTVRRVYLCDGRAPDYGFELWACRKLLLETVRTLLRLLSDDSRVVGNPYLIWLRQSCPSLGLNLTLQLTTLYVGLTG
jgi:hypothetical protein